MNSTRPEALPVKWNWRYGRLYRIAFLLAALAMLAAGMPATVFAAQKKKPKKDSSPTPAPEASPTPQPQTPGGSAPDLQLKPEDEQKADALANFIDGNIAEDNADLDKALDDYRKVLAVDPAAVIRSEDDTDTTMLLAAKVAFELARRGNSAEGIDVLKDAAKAAPKEPMTYYFLSQLYSKYLKKYDVALKYATQALDLDPKNFLFHLADYELEINLGQNAKAVETLDRAGKLDNDDPMFWLKMSELYIHALVKDDGTCTPEDQKKMDAVFQKALTLSKNDPVTAAKVGDYYVLTKQIKEAIPLYEGALAAKRDASDLSLSSLREKLAACYVANGQHDEAIKVLEALIKNDPMRASTYETLGQLYAEKNEFEKALNSYQQMLLLNPDQPTNYLRVSDMMFQLKKFDKAVDLLTETHKKFPPTRSARR